MMSKWVQKFLNLVLTKEVNELKLSSLTERSLKWLAPNFLGRLADLNRISGAGKLLSLEVFCILWMPLFDK
jgi:hypothetical protein